jgi:hypothetical protein
MLSYPTYTGNKRNRKAQVSASTARHCVQEESTLLDHIVPLHSIQSALSAGLALPMHCSKHASSLTNSPGAADLKSLIIYIVKLASPVQQRDSLPVGLHCPQHTPGPHTPQSDCPRKTDGSLQQQQQQQQQEEECTHSLSGYLVGFLLPPATT